MRTRALTSTFLLALPYCFGCSTPTTLRPGVWELSFALQESETREPLPFVKPRLVQLQVERGDEPDGGEIAEIVPLAAEDQPGAPAGAAGTKLTSRVPPLYGDIRIRGRDHLPSIQVAGADRDWNFTLTGLVRSPEYVEGTHMGAKYRGRRDLLLLEGVWSMRWLRDE